MKRVQRFDIARMDKLNVTPEGFLETSVRAARTGILVYKDANGKEFRELCLPDELFNQKSTDSMKMKPVTNGHPFELLTSENAKDYQVGFTGENVEQDGKFLKIGKVVITDKATIDDVERGKQEVSCGYQLELDMQEGYWDDVNEEVNREGRGEKFDAIQRNRMYNHLALVDRGRAGSQVRLRLDGDLNLIEEDDTMKIKIGNKEFEVSQDVAAAFDAFVVQMSADHDKLANELNEIKRKNADDKDGQIATLKSENEKLKGNNDALKAKLDEATDKKKLQERVDERMSLMATAQAIMDADDEQMEKFKTMDDAAVKRAVVEAKLPGVKLDDKSEDYVDGQFEVLAHNQNSDNGDDGDELGKKLVDGRKDRADEDGNTDKAREERSKKDGDAWKKPVGPLAGVNEGK
jgi:hypothetical protein